MSVRAHTGGSPAVFGSYDDAPAAAGLVARYKNLYHHYVHQRSGASAQSFWAGCGAVRRSAFLAVGGFDEERYPRPSIEDIELGYRLTDAGYRIRFRPDLMVKHLKASLDKFKVAKAEQDDTLAAIDGLKKDIVAPKP